MTLVLDCLDIYSVFSELLSDGPDSTDTRTKSILYIKYTSAPRYVYQEQFKSNFSSFSSSYIIKNVYAYLDVKV